MFYEKLEIELQKRSINLNQLSKDTGIAQPTTSRWKAGGLPGAEALIKVCKYLNVSADYLLDLNEETPPPQVSEKELQLINDFRLCDAGRQESIKVLASSGAAEALKKESLNSKIVG